jgi:hypothetical protein
VGVPFGPGRGLTPKPSAGGVAREGPSGGKTLHTSTDAVLSGHVRGLTPDTSAGDAL